MAAMKLIEAGTLFIKTHKLQMWTLETLRRFSVQKIINIGQYLLKLFENVVGVRFFWTSVYTYTVSQKRC